MPGTYLGFPFDEELFLMNWKNLPDTTLTAMLNSGALQSNAEIARLISNGSDLYTIPFYNLIGGTPDNYDGETNITVTDTTGSSQSGIVYGRAHAWKAQDFVIDFNSGADPMMQITSQVGYYWQKQRQQLMLKVLEGIFGTSDDSGKFLDSWKTHSTDLTVKSDTEAAEENMLGEASGAEAAQQACGDNSGIFSMAIMHSRVALNLAKKQLLTFRKYTDPNGIERTLNIADYNGMTVVVDDGVGATKNSAASSHNVYDYTTYFFGRGALQFATAPVKTPVEIGRERLEKGGYDYMVTRLRETIHPNGFTYKQPSSSYKKSPTDAQLKAPANWLIAYDPKSIAIAKVVSNG